MLFHTRNSRHLSHRKGIAVVTTGAGAIVVHEATGPLLAVGATDQFDGYACFQVETHMHLIRCTEPSGKRAIFQIEAFPDLPFLFLTAKALKVDKLKGFRLGCDDYFVKPIDEELLLARIHAIMNRSGHGAFAQKEPESFQLGTLTFRVSDQVLTKGKDQQFLTDKEAQLLAMLCAHQNRLLPRRKALQQIWGTHDEFSRKSMDVFIFRLRKYLDGQTGIRIRNVHGKGFVLELDVDPLDRRG
jgi:DNA-binding response OmpR family regulator